MSVSVIIPIFNEKSIIKKNLMKIEEFLSKNFDDYEIIVVDDGSFDGSIEEITLPNITIISLGQNYGKGAAVRVGMLYAYGDYAFFTDADLPYPLTFITDGVEKLKQYDLVCGNRFGEYPIYRKVMSNLYNKYVKAVLDISADDVQCGIKGFQKRVYKDIFSRCKCNGFAFDTETLFLAKKLEYSVCCINVPLTHRIGSSVGIITDTIQMFIDVIKINSNFEKGEYNLQKVFR